MRELAAKTGLVLILIVIAACAGCTTQKTTIAPGDSGQGSSQKIPFSGSSSGGSFPPAGSTVNESQIRSDNFSWVEYKHTDSNKGITTDSTYRIEGKPEEYGGQPAYHSKTTITKADGSVRIDDVYWDPSKKDTLGGTMTVTSGGQTMATPIKPYKPAAGGTEFEESIPFTFEGAEPLTVPYGTYAEAGKYIKQFTPPGSTYEITETDWVVPGIAPPLKYIQYHGTDKNTYSVNELKAWG
jgi:hypothetical protein